MSTVMSIEQNRDLAFRGFDAINRQDAANLTAVFSPKWAAEINGWFPRINATWAGHHVEVAELVAEGDKVWCRLRTSGTHSGEWAGIPATGKRWANTGLWFLRIVDGRIVEVEWLFDEIGLMRQLGVSITPVDAAA